MGKNKVAVFSTMGASNYADLDRQKEDFYATNPKALDILFEHLHIDKQDAVWECCAGLGHLSQALRERGFTNVRATELYRREGALDDKIEFDVDFLFNFNYITGLDTHVITNPPYQNSEDFIITALESVANGKFVCFWLPIRYLAGKSRKLLFNKYPVWKVVISSGRMNCARNGDFEKYSNSAIDFAWFIWEKGYNGEAVIKWV